MRALGPGRGDGATADLARRRDALRRGRPPDDHLHVRDDRAAEGLHAAPPPLLRHGRDGREQSPGSWSGAIACSSTCRWLTTSPGSCSTGRRARLHGCLLPRRRPHPCRASRRFSDDPAERAPAVREGEDGRRRRLRRGDRPAPAPGRLGARGRAKDCGRTGRSGERLPPGLAAQRVARRAARLRQGESKARRPPALRRLGRRAARDRGRGVLPHPRRRDPRGLRPDRVHDRVARQPARPLPVRDGRPARFRASRRASADDGEIMLRGETVFAGYWGDERATREVLPGDGWLHTGDVGSIDADGFLTITDRKKDVIITAGGKNVSPQNIENALRQSPFVSQALVVGDRRPYLAALVSVEHDEVARVARTADEVEALVERAVADVNRDLGAARADQALRDRPAGLPARGGRGHTDAQAPPARLRGALRPRDRDDVRGPVVTASCYLRRPMRAATVIACLVTLWLGLEGAATAQPSGAPLEARLARTLRVEGVSPAATGALAVDVSSGATVFARNPGKAFQPASNEKLATGLTALDELGLGFRIRTVVHGEGERRGPRWNGDLVLKGFGDPELSRADLDALAREPPPARNPAGERPSGRRRVVFRLPPDGSGLEGVVLQARVPAPVGARRRPCVARRTNLGQACARRRHRFQARPRAGRDPCRRRRRPSDGPAPRPSSSRACRRRPMRRLVKVMETESDNFYAEMLLKLLGAEELERGTTAAGREGGTPRARRSETFRSPASESSTDRASPEAIG